MTASNSTPAGNNNVFLDPGVPEAKALGLLLLDDLSFQILKAIDRLGMTETAKRKGIAQPNMNEMIKSRSHKSKKWR